MKMLRLLPVLALTFLSAGAIAQITVYGKVKDVSGNMLHYAFVKDVVNKKAAYTDSVGGFSIETQAGATLSVSCLGYKDTTVTVAGANTNLNIALRPVVNVSGNRVGGNEALSTGTTNLLRTTLGDLINNGTPTAQSGFTKGAELTEIHEKEETKGSRFFLKYWTRGYVVNSNGDIVEDPTFLFDYDKQDGGLLLTKDKKTVIEIDRDKVQSFTIFDNVGQAFTFKPVTDIDKTHYVQVLSEGGKYSIYKLTKVTFTKADFRNDGIMAQGNRYDEYTDDNTYFIVDMKTKQMQKLTPKKKALKNAFPNDSAKLAAYLKDNDADVDDNYLAGLGDFMNKP